jgi:hypothetical protein
MKAGGSGRERATRYPGWGAMWLEYTLIGVFLLWGLASLLLVVELRYLAQPIQFGTSPVVSEDVRNLGKALLGQESHLD